MNRVLLVDDSPHAQRIGERILSDEGFEVVTVSNADSAFVRLEDADPDVVIADTVMPGRTGFEICQYIKVNPRFRHLRVILTAGVLEPFDDEQIKRAGADATLKKPFEASLLVATVRPLAEASRLARERGRAGGATGVEPLAPAAPAPTAFVAVVEPDQVRAAVTVALDASMESMIEEISRRVMAALRARPAGEVESQPVSSVLRAQSVASALPAQSVASALPAQSVASALRAQSVASALPAQSVASALPAQSVASALPAQSVASALPAQSVASALPAQAVTSAPPGPPAPAVALPAPPSPASTAPTPESERAVTPAAPPAPVLPGPAPAASETVRRVHPVRLRSRGSSVLGLDSYPPDSETPPDSQS